MEIDIVIFITTGWRWKDRMMEWYPCLGNYGYSSRENPLIFNDGMCFICKSYPYFNLSSSSALLLKPLYIVGSTVPFNQSLNSTRWNQEKTLWHLTTFCHNEWRASVSKPVLWARWFPTVDAMHVHTWLGLQRVTGSSLCQSRCRHVPPSPQTHV